MRRTYLTGTLACVAVLTSIAACGGESSKDATAPLLSSHAESGPSASGHANWINAAGESVSRSFHARIMPSDSVRGEFVQWVTALNGARRKNQSEIDCIHFLAPNDVMLSGPVRVISNPVLRGQTQIFRVRDNGEGADAADEQSHLFFRQPSTGLDCRTFPPPATTPIEGGNIQVRP